LSAFVLERANGTAASPSGLLANDIIGAITSHGYGATGYFGGSAQMRFVADQNWSDSVQGTSITFFTTPNGSTAVAGLAERVRITNAGNLGIGTTTPWAKLAVDATSLPTGIQEFVVGASGHTDFVINQNGNVGIGTSSPTTQGSSANGVLTIQPSSGVGYILLGTFGTSNDYGAISFSGSLSTTNYNFTSSITDQNLYINRPTGKAIRFRDNNVDQMSLLDNGNLGIGTTNPFSRLQISGPDTASSTSAFAVVNSASTTLFSVFDGGNAQLSGTLTQSSDRRLKTNIQNLDASSSLASINSLTPVAYVWLDPEKGGGRQYGFIAQDVQQVFPDLVATTSATALTPNGTLGLNYIGLIAPLVEAVQMISTELVNLGAKVAGFAQSFTSKQITATNQLCVEKSDGTAVCITGDQLAGILSGAPSVHISAPMPLVASGTSTPPSINIQGSNPATINVGDTYTDLGAIVHDNQGHDLSYRTFINGILSGNILIDTTQIATDTIDYVATDTWGNTSTSTRTVVIEATSSLQ
jgi:hypothetical protein